MRLRVRWLLRFTRAVTAFPHSVWDLDFLLCRRTLTGHKDDVTGLAALPLHRTGTAASLAASLAAADPSLQAPVRPPHLPRSRPLAAPCQHPCPALPPPRARPTHPQGHK